MSNEIRSGLSTAGLFYRAGVMLLAVGMLSGPLADTKALANPSAADDYTYDQYNAEDIMELCAGCHGEIGQGGGGGEYPRLAGLPAKYLAKQMRDFRDGARESIAMMPYADERELPETDLLDITTYLAAIELLPKMPLIDQNLDSLVKLKIVQRVFNVPRLEGDTELGRQVYDAQCKKCHGKGGIGRASVPAIGGQYSAYIRLQISNFKTGKRVNEKMDKYIQSLTEVEISGLLAYLSVADD